MFFNSFQKILILHNLFLRNGSMFRRSIPLTKFEISEKLFEKMEEGGISHLNKSNIHNKQPSFI